MNLLRIININLAVIILIVTIYHFLIEELHIYVVFLCLSVYLLVNGIQQVAENRKDWIGYLSIGTGVILFVGVVIEFLLEAF